MKKEYVIFLRKAKKLAKFLEVQLKAMPVSTVAENDLGEIVVSYDRKLRAELIAKWPTGVAFRVRLTNSFNLLVGLGEDAIYFGIGYFLYTIKTDTQILPLKSKHFIGCDISLRQGKKNFNFLDLYWSLDKVEENFNKFYKESILVESHYGYILRTYSVEQYDCEKWLNINDNIDIYKNNYIEELLKELKSKKYIKELYDTIEKSKFKIDIKDESGQTVATYRNYEDAYKKYQELLGGDAKDYDITCLGVKLS